jgi:OFA family oxalate/formate antiporter-like MFS transporter
MNKGGTGLGLTLPALSFALTLDRIMNGICRPFFGWVSDTIGRELTRSILPIKRVTLGLFFCLNYFEPGSFNC